MAIWCKNCLQQQNDVQAALARLPAGRVVFIVLDIDPNEDASSLAAYRDQHGPFASLDDLGEVSGIGPAKIEALRGL